MPSERVQADSSITPGDSRTGILSPPTDLRARRARIAIGVLAAGVAWALEQGARLADHQPQDDVRVMLDPEGHPFCLFYDDRL